MNARDKQKFIKLAAQTKEKTVPDGWVYVGKGKANGLGFGNTLRARSLEESHDPGWTKWAHEQDCEGGNDYFEYAAPVAIWESVVGVKFGAENVEELSEKFWINVGASPFLSEAVQKHAFEIEYGWIVGGKIIQHKERKTLVFGIDKNSICFLSAGDDINKYGPEISIDKFFTMKKAKPKTLSIADFIPGHNVFVSKDGLVIGCQKVSLENWAKLDKKVTEFLDKKTGFPADFCVKIDAPYISEAVQKHSFELGWKWRDGTKGVENTTAKYLYFYSSGTITHDDSYNSNRKILTLTDFFNLKTDKTLTIPAGPVPSYEVVVTKENIVVAGLTVTAANWRKFGKQINNFIAEI